MANPKGKGGFKPGKSGNPTGRPKGFNALVREATKGGADIVEFMIKVFDGKAGDEFNGKDRIRAAEWLAERGWGKPAQPLTGEDGEGPMQIRATVRYVRANVDDE